MRWVAIAAASGVIGGCDGAFTPTSVDPSAVATRAPVPALWPAAGLAGRASITRPAARPTPAPDTPATSDACDACGGLGAVRGQTCAPSERTFVADATVVLSGAGCDGAPYQATTTSRADGTWGFVDVPCGRHTVTTQKGAFTADSVVDVVGGQVADTRGAAQKLCLARDTTRIAVLGGEWDDLGALVGDLGFAFDRYSEHPDPDAVGLMHGLLADPAMLAEYDVLVIGCGRAAGRMAIDHAEVMPHVRDFVLAGGSLYTSDYAWTFGEAAFPDAVAWVGDDDPRSMGDVAASPQRIPGGLTVDAHVTDPTLAAQLGRDSVAITFEEGPQIAPEAAGPGTTVHVAADLALPGGSVAAAPIALSYVPAPGAGRVVYTNFHNDAQATEPMRAVMRYLVLSL